MKNILSAVSYGLLFSSINFLQAHPEEQTHPQKETAINFLNEHQLLTKSYLKSSYDHQGLVVDKLAGNSDHAWQLTFTNNKLALNFSDPKEKNSYIIDDFELLENEVLHLSSSEKNQHFWFHKDYILSETRDDELETIENKPTHQLDWYYFS